MGYLCSMIENIPLYRPGLTAIAAVLALSSTSIIAQVALPDVTAQPVSVGLPAEAVQSASVAPKLPDIDVIKASPQTASSEQTVARQEAHSPRLTAEAGSKRAALAPEIPLSAPDLSVPVPVERAPLTMTAPTPAVAANEPVMVKPMRGDANASADMGYAGWILLGGGLLIVAGGAAFAMRRRPKPHKEVRAYSKGEGMSAPHAVSREPNARPLPFAPDRAAQKEMHPPRAAAPHSRGMGGSACGDHHALLEVMVAKAPTEANPFHTRRNRIRRADFLLRTGQAEERGLASAQQRYDGRALIPDRWSEMRFAGKQNARVSWKPATAR